MQSHLPYRISFILPSCVTSCTIFVYVRTGRSVFAYGQTSTGKTHTMQGTEEQPGVIPLAIEECFSYVSTSNDDRYVLHGITFIGVGGRGSWQSARKLQTLGKFISGGFFNYRGRKGGRVATLPLASSKGSQFS